MLRNPASWVILISFLLLLASYDDGNAAGRHVRFTGETVFREFTDRLYQPDRCGRRCRDAGADCMAWSYEGPPPRAPIGSTSRCVLLKSFRSTVSDRRFVSALAEEPLPGDLNNQCVRILPADFAPYLPTRISTPNPGMCEQKCRDMPSCRAWTYHKAVTAPGTTPLSCSLTGQDPPSFQTSNSCLSGRR